MDKRTDIWAFGCVLYEMLTRRAAFQRDTVTDTLAAVVQSEADWSRLPANIPTGVRRLLGRCLEKDPKRRLRDIGDARVDLDPEADDVRPGLAGAGTTTSQSLPPARAGALMPQTWVDRDRRRGHPRRRTRDRVTVDASAVPLSCPVSPLRVSVNPPPGGEFRLQSGSEISPDGRLIVYVAHTGDVDRLWLRQLDELSARELPGTEERRILSGRRTAGPLDSSRLASSNASTLAAGLPQSSAP